MTIKEVAALAGISVRTLQHYDQIHLLSPARIPENEYRNYDDKDLDKLQHILFFKECGFSLIQIKNILDHPHFDRNKAFELQKKYLLKEKEKIEKKLQTLEKTMKGEKEMSQKEKFYGFDFSHNPYEEEARQLWGDEVVENSNKMIEPLSSEEKGEISKQMHELFTRLGQLLTEAPDSNKTQDEIKFMYTYFNRTFGNYYTPEVFAGLGQLYVSDTRFTENIDQYGQGLSAFLAEAMRIFSEKQNI